jgi:hypothetical protein
MHDKACPGRGKHREFLVTVATRASVAVPAPAAAAAATTTTTTTAITATTAAAAEATTPPAAAAEAATTTATTATTAEAALARCTFLAGTGDVHGERTSAEVLAMEHFHGPLRLLGGGELDEGEAAGAARELVEHEVHVEDDTRASEVILDVPFHRLVGEIAHEQTVLIFHNDCDRFKHRVGICPWAELRLRGAN